MTALYNYDVAVKTAAPKRQALADASEELASVSLVLEVICYMQQFLKLKFVCLGKGDSL